MKPKVAHCELLSMKHKFFTLLGTLSLASLGLSSIANPAQALKLGPGTLSLQNTEGLFTANNIIDFVSPGSIGIGNGSSLGLAGVINSTTPPNPPVTSSGIFGQPLLGGGTLVGTSGFINDFAFDPTTIPDKGCNLGSDTSNRLCNDVAYTLADFGIASPIELFTLDSTTDSERIDYFVTGFIRRTEESPTGGFTVTFDAEGFFVDNLGFYEDTPSEVSVFVGTSEFDPQTEQIKTFAEFSNPAEQNEFVAGFNATITTSVPEPTSIMGLIGTIGIGLGSSLRKKKA